MTSIKIFQKFIAVTLLFSFFGCTTKLVDEGAPVKLVDTTDLKMIKNYCEPVGRFEGASGGATPEIGKMHAVYSLRNLVGRGGGNLVVSNEKFREGMGFWTTRYKVQGLGFDCPRKVLRKLIDTSGI